MTRRGVKLHLNEAGVKPLNQGDSKSLMLLGIGVQGAFGPGVLGVVLNSRTHFTDIHLFSKEAV